MSNKISSMSNKKKKKKTINITGIYSRVFYKELSFSLKGPAAWSFVLKSI